MDDLAKLMIFSDSITFSMITKDPLMIGKDLS